MTGSANRDIQIATKTIFEYSKKLLLNWDSASDLYPAKSDYLYPAKVTE